MKAVDLINGLVQRWVTVDAEKQEAAARAYLTEEVRTAIFEDPGGALWASDVDRMAEIAVRVFTEFLRDPPTFTACGVCGDTWLNTSEKAFRFDQGNGICRHQEPSRW